jgi:CMP-N,N'-diacetyllegionaminic acid synthase
VDVLALIPARGGSKGIPRKSVREIAGKPLVAWSIEQALASTLVERTIVSTDDAEIADVARAFGAEVPFMRPAEFAADDSLDIDVFRHALEWLGEHDGRVPELIVHLRPTAPLRAADAIDRAVRAMLDDPDADSLRSVSRPLQSPYKMWRIEDGLLEPLVSVPGTDEPYNEPRQSLPAVWWQNGVVDVVRARTVLELGSMTGRRILAFRVEGPVVELDYEDSIPAAERLLLADAGEPSGVERHPS